MTGVDLNTKQELQLLLVASSKHLSRGDIRSLVQYLEKEDCGFKVKLQLSDPTEQPELLELHRLVAIPALVKLSPAPKQIFAGSSIFQQLRNYQLEVFHYPNLVMEGMVGIESIFTQHQDH